MLNKKAAMFGLDARIALAIFGALSIISGAALFNVIGNVKATRLLTELNEIGKAWEAYYVDTNKPVPQDSTSPANVYFYRLRISSLIEDLGVKGWKGPYLPYTKSTYYHLNHPEYDTLQLYMLTNDTEWGDNIYWSASPGGKCLSGTKCYVWIELFYVKDLDFIKRIDAIADKSDGAKLGDFKWYKDGASGYRIYKKLAPVFNPND